nr:leucine-rich repeat domain-containing protein [Ruminococcus sp.]
TRWTVYPYDVSTGEADTAHPVSADDYEKLFGPDFDPAKENTSIQNNTRDPYLFAPTYSRALVPAVLEYEFFDSYGNGTGPCVIQAQVKRIVSGTVVDLPATVKEYVDYGNDTIELVQPVFAWDYESSGVWFWNGHSYSRPFRNNNQVVVLNLYHANCPGTTGSISLYPTSLGETAYAMGGATGCENLETINLGEGIESVFEFYDNPNLTTVNLPATLKKISRSGTILYQGELGAFQNDKKLRNITLPTGLQFIESSSFKNCTSLSSINIPSGVMLDSGAFEGSGLTHVTLPGNTQYYSPNFRVQSHSIFKNCKKLWSVIMEDGANSVPRVMFMGCSSLTDVSLPDTLSTINKSAFEGCSSLEEITIPDNVSTIGEAAFKDCSSLKSIEIPEGVTKIEKETFKNCTSLESVTLPSTITYIDAEAFRNCPKLNNVVIPENVTEIGNFAFYDCSSMESINIPSGVSVINQGSFENCTSLNEVTIDYTGDNFIIKGVIGDWQNELEYGKRTFGAFENCSSLGAITLPEHTTSIGLYVFKDCTKLESIYLGNSLESIGVSAFENCQALAGTITLPETVTSIGSSAFRSCKSLRGITIPDGVEEINESTFQNCGLNNVTIGSGVKTIGNYAFDNCTVLHAPTLPDGLETIGECAFRDTTSYFFNNLVIPGSVKSIAYLAFYRSNLTDLTIGDGFNGEINPNAFYRVNDLSINGNTVIDWTTHGWAAYVDDRTYHNWLVASLNYLHIRGTEVADHAFENLTEVTEIDFTDDITTIGDYAFSGCTRLCRYHSSFEIPDTVTDIGEHAFDGCVEIYRLKLGESVETIGAYAFSRLNISEITIPKSVESIGEGAFANPASSVTISSDSELTDLSSGAFNNRLYYLSVPGDGSFDYQNLPTGGISKLVVTGDSINSEAFSGRRYDSVEISDSVKTVGQNAFKNSGIYGVKIGDNVNTLPANAFDGCSEIRSLNVNGNGSYNYANLPKSKVRNLTVRGEAVKSSAFISFPELMEVTINNTVSSIGTYAFSNCPNVEEITIPEAVTDLREGVFQGCLGLEKITLGDHITRVGERAFNGCTSLKDISLPDTVETLDYAAFMNCTSLPYIIIPESVEYVGASAFNNCTSLRTAVLTDGVENVGAQAFYNCNSLTSLEFPDSLKTIGDSAYDSCSKLKNLTIPRSVNSIGTSTFKDCTDLQTAFVWGRTTTVGDSAFANAPDLTIYAYDSSPTDTYALNADIPFFPIVNTNLGDDYDDEPITDTQTVEDNDTGFGLYMDVFNNLELLGVQLKTDEGTNDMRFVAVLNEGIVAEATRTHDIEDYGFVVAKTRRNSTYSVGENNIQKITLGAPSTMTLSCRKTSNKVSGNYGIYSTSDTKYKYITLGVKNVDRDPNQGLAVRFYVKTHSGRIYYANYINDFSGCAASYSLLFEGDNSTLFRDERNEMALKEDE